MKILIIHRSKENFEGALLLHLIYQKMLQINDTDLFEMDLMVMGNQIEESIFFDPNVFNKIFSAPSLLSLFLKRKTTFQYDWIITLCFDFYAMVYHHTMKASKKKMISKKQHEKIRLLSTFDRETEMAEQIIKSFYDVKFASNTSTSPLHISEEKLKNTEYLINWILVSSNQKNLAALHYIYFHFKIQNIETDCDYLINQLKSLRKNKLHKVVLVLESTIPQKQIEKSLGTILVPRNESSLVLDFVFYNDLYFWYKLAEKAQLIVTNNQLLVLICNSQNWLTISSQKETLTTDDQASINKRLEYYLKTS